MMTPAVSRWLLYWPTFLTLEMADSWITEARKVAGRGDGLPMAAERRSDGATLGWIMVNRSGEDRRKASFGYWLGEEHHGRGYMGEAAPIAVQAGFKLLDVDVIEAAVQPGHEASQRVLLKCGFKEVGSGELFSPVRQRNDFYRFYQIERQGY